MEIIWELKYKYGKKFPSHFQLQQISWVQKWELQFQKIYRTTVGMQTNQARKSVHKNSSVVDRSSESSSEESDSQTNSENERNQDSSVGNLNGNNGGNHSSMIEFKVALLTQLHCLMLVYSVVNPTLRTQTKLM